MHIRGEEIYNRCFFSFPLMIHSLSVPGKSETVLQRRLTRWAIAGQTHRFSLVQRSYSQYDLHYWSRQQRDGPTTRTSMHTRINMQEIQIYRERESNISCSPTDRIRDKRQAARTDSRWATAPLLDTMETTNARLTLASSDVIQLSMAQDQPSSRVGWVLSIAVDVHATLLILLCISA